MRTRNEQQLFPFSGAILKWSANLSVDSNKYWIRSRNTLSISLRRCGIIFCVSIKIISRNVSAQMDFLREQRRRDPWVSEWVYGRKIQLSLCIIQIALLLWVMLGIHVVILYFSLQFFISIAKSFFILCRCKEEIPLNITRPTLHVESSARIAVYIRGLAGCELE